MVDENQNTGNDQTPVVPPATPPATPPAPQDKSNQAPADPFSALGFTDEDKDIREWVAKTGFKSPRDVAKSAYEQQKLLGNAVRIPGDNATPEELAAFREKLGAPKEPAGYEFAAPKDLPEDLPYDGERADAFKAKAHELGLSKTQAAALHDWFVGATVEDFKAVGGAQAEQQKAAAQAETQKLVKEWGPLDGPQMRTNLAFADKALREVGGDEALAEFQRVGLIGGGSDKVIQSAAIAKMLSKLGAALYTEDSVLRGNPDSLDNPFSEGTLDVTAQMKAWKADPDHARSLIAAAGKKPSDFGLK